MSVLDKALRAAVEVISSPATGRAERIAMQGERAAASGEITATKLLEDTHSFRADAIWKDAQTAERVHALREHQAQLRSYPVKNVRELSDEGGEYPGVYRANLADSDNSPLVVRSRRPSSMLNHWTPEISAQEVSPALFGTVLPGVERQVKFSAFSNKYAYVQPEVGESLVMASHRLTGRELGDISGSITKFRKPVEEGLVERAILGDHDGHSLNYRVLADEQRIHKMFGIDLEDAFAHRHDPIWPRRAYPIWQESLAQRPLLPSTSERVTQFLTGATRPHAHLEFHKLGIYDTQIDAMLGRAEWFDRHKTFPPLSRDLVVPRKLDDM